MSGEAPTLPAGPRPVSAAPVSDTPDTPRDFRIIAWFATHFDRPFSASAVAARLQGGFDANDPRTLARAMDAIGLKSRLYETGLRGLDPIVLPCILFDKAGAPLVLLELSKRRRQATVLSPGDGGPERQMPLRKLQRQIDDQVMLVTLHDEHASRRMAPEMDVDKARGEHWFWSPVRANWGGWLQVLMASLLLNMMGLALPLFIMNVYDKVIPNLAFVTLWTLAIGVGLAIGADLILRTVRAHVLENISRRVDLKAAASLFRHALNIRLLNRQAGAAGLASQIREYEAVREFFASATFVSFVDLLFIGVFLGVLYIIVGPLALVPTLAIPVVLVIALIARLPMGRMVGKSIEMSAKRHTVLMESLLGFETVKALNAEPVLQREWENAVSASARVNGRTRFWSNFSTSGALMAQQFVSVTIIVWGVYLVFQEQITVGALIAANILAGRALAPLSTIAQTVFRAQYAFKSLASLNRMMQLPGERGAAVKSNLRVKTGALAIKDVTFTYPGSDVPAINALTLDLQPGEVVALLGRVGSGKTTLGKLVSGLLSPDSGTIVVDGFGLAQYDPAELRDGIGYLPQQAELFTGTLHENLVIGRPNATQDEIEAALYYSGLSDFVAQSSDGLNLFAGEKGNRLSGGQAQALSLARLILRRPKLMFLDEPTNAMDQEMEGRVCARLKELGAEGTGLVLCTHRQSLAAVADRFVVLDQGRKILDGPREEVMRRLLQNQTAAANSG